MRWGRYTIHDEQECVICGTVYVSENDTGGLERPVSSDTRAYAASRASPVASGSRKGKEANRNESLKVKAHTLLELLALTFFIGAFAWHAMSDNRSRHHCGFCFVLFT
jgi:hypothetical protein